MKPLVIILALAASGCATGGAAAPEGRDETAELSARLAGATFGRVPGPPVSCITLAEVRGNRALGSELVLFEGNDGRQWVNRVGSCPGLNYGRELRIASATGRLCRGDTAQTVDPRTGQAVGGCTMGDFLTYVPR